MVSTQNHTGSKLESMRNIESSSHKERLIYPKSCQPRKVISNVPSTEKHAPPLHRPCWFTSHWIQPLCKLCYKLHYLFLCYNFESRSIDKQTKHSKMIELKYPYKNYINHYYGIFSTVSIVE